MSISRTGSQHRDKRPAGRPAGFVPVRVSLSDLLGADYVRAVCQARSAVSGQDAAALLRLAQRKVDLFPRRFQRALAARLGDVGSRVTAPLAGGAEGATTKGFRAATHRQAAPLTGWGYYRVGEDGRLYLTTKSEHYHVPLGHGFPGYRLLEHARRLGLCSATHNNTRGHVTRRLESELLAAANAPDGEGRGGGLDCVLNLQTGSLAVEAGLKMMLARFYRVQGGAGGVRPPAGGSVPVFGVLGDADGGPTANYHGTTMLTQVLRGMWPELAAGLAEAGLFRVAPVRPNVMEDLQGLFERHARGPQRLAGFLHELVLMNYGGLRLAPAFVRRLYELCEQHGVPTLCDEIQSCVWAPELFLFREYGVRPSFVAVGKGLPGGEYPASRILFRAEMDTLPQFGALVTNGQEELASLAYLVTMRWARENAEATRAVGQYYRERLEDLAAAHPRQIDTVEGRGHMGTLWFRDVETAEAFARAVAAGGVDISVQSYKAACPPAALTKLPLIADRPVVDFLVGRFAAALEQIGSGRHG